MAENLAVSVSFCLAGVKHTGFLCTFAFVKTKAIVLKVVRHSDTSVVAHLFTQMNGCMAFAVRRPSSGRSQRHTLSSSLLQPLTQLIIECNTAPTDKLRPLVNAEICQPYTSIPFSPEKAAVAMFLSEFLWAALRNEQPSAALYDFVSLSLQWFDEAEEGYANFHLIFLLQLARYLGYDPTLLPEAQGLQIETLMRHSYRTMRLLQLNGVQRTHYLRCLIAFYRDKLPSFPQINSIDILADIF